jgi:hypothetical protein
MAVVTPWTEANDKFTQNLSGSTSIAAGYMGSDVATSIDLGGTRILWLLGDTFWATAAGQTRSQCLFLRNAVALQTGSYDLGSATLTFYAGIAPDGTGSTPGSFFPEFGPANAIWPISGCMIDDKLLITCFDVQPANNSFGFGVAGWRAILIDNPSAAPSAWIKTVVEVPSADTEPAFTVSLIDPGDGYVYNYGQGKDEAMYVMRWPRLDAKAGRLMDPEYWYGSSFGWTRNLPQGRTRPRPASVCPAPTAGDGSIHQQSDGDWLIIQMPGFGGTSLSSATSSSLSGPFGTLTSFYTPPESTATGGGGQPIYLVYAGKGHPELSWSGKAIDDIACSYATNGTGGNSVYTDMNCYWPRFVKVSGL